MFISSEHSHQTVHILFIIPHISSHLIYHDNSYYIYHLNFISQQINPILTHIVKVNLKRCGIISQFHDFIKSHFWRVFCYLAQLCLPAEVGAARLPRLPTRLHGQGRKCICLEVAQKESLASLGVDAVINSQQFQIDTFAKTNQEMS